MKIQTVLCCTALLGIAVHVVAAQPAQQSEIRRTFATPGTFELGGSASLSSTTEVNSGATSDPMYNMTLSPTAGYFVGDGLEILIDPLTVSYAWTGSVKSLTMLPMAGVAYNFRAHPRAFPYVEGLAGFAYSWLDNGVTPAVSRSGFAWAGRVGLKALMTPTAIVNIGVQYQQVTLNRTVGVPTETGRNGYNQFALTFGLAVWL